MKRKGATVTVRTVCKACASSRLQASKEPCGRAPCLLAAFYARAK